MTDAEVTGTASSAGDTSTTSARDLVIQTHGLKRYYPITGGPLKRKIGDVKAVDGVDLKIEKGKTLGLVGESGCGKSTLARILVGLDDPTDGHIYYDVPASDAAEIEELEAVPEAERSAEDGDRLDSLRAEYDLVQLGKAERAEYRQDVQFVFQNPRSSLNPRQLIRDIVARPLKLSTDLDIDEREARVAELLEECGLGADFMYRYPHMLSGGQCQRVAIARAIAMNPDFIVLDEPTSALDVSVQAQILNLLDDLQEKLDLTYLFITHDLGVIRHMADDIAVMYLGRLVEHTSKRTLFSEPKHPYSEALLSSSPAIPTEDRIFLEGDVPDPENPPTGCRFHTRCHRAEAKCGWSGRDLLSLLHTHSEEMPAVGEIYESVSDTDFEGYHAEFSFGRSADVDRAARYLRGDEESLRSKKPVLFEAIERVEVDGRTIVVDFVERPVPEIHEVAPNQQVSCFLYE